MQDACKMWRWDCMKASWKHDESSMKSLWYLYERAMKEPWNDHEVTKNYLKKARKRLLKWAGPAHESLSGPWVPLSDPSATQSAPHLPSHALQKSGKTFGIFCWEQPMACLGARTATSTAYFRGGCILPDLQLTSKPNPNHNPPRKQILARLVSRAVLPPVWPKSLHYLSSSLCSSLQSPFVETSDRVHTYPIIYNMKEKMQFSFTKKKNGGWQKAGAHRDFRLGPSTSRWASKVKLLMLFLSLWCCPKEELVRRIKVQTFLGLV